MQEIDQRDRELLGALQSEIPVVSTPFAVIGQQIDMSEKEVIKRLERLKREGVVAHVGATFDARALGYRTCLVAARVDQERVDDLAAHVSAHPGVTQNYRRNHEFNLWFTLSLAPSSVLGLERTIEILGDELDAQAIRALPTLRVFHSTAHESGPEQSHDIVAEHASDAAVSFSASETECVRILQHELPLQPRPFDNMARTFGTLSAEDILGGARSLLRNQQMRRFAVSLQPRKPGFSATAMGVWKVPESKTESVGTMLAAHRGVSHCYLRPVYDDWAYNMFTTVHGRSVDECESIISELVAETGVEERCALYPTKEYKKERLQFFTPELDAWEATRVNAAVKSAAS